MIPAQRRAISNQIEFQVAELPLFDVRVSRSISLECTPLCVCKLVLVLAWPT